MFNQILVVYFCFCFFCLSINRSKKNITRIYVKEYSAYVLFQEFYGFRSYIQVFNPFEFFFLSSVRKCSNFILLMQLPSFPNTTYRRNYLFSIVHFYLYCYRLNDSTCVSLFLDSLFQSTDLCICFCISIMLFINYCSFVKQRFTK